VLVGETPFRRFMIDQVEVDGTEIRIVGPRRFSNGL
jgi:hypothetical protein